MSSSFFTFFALFAFVSAVCLSSDDDENDDDNTDFFFEERGRASLTDCVRDREEVESDETEGEEESEGMCASV